MDFKNLVNQSLIGPYAELERIYQENRALLISPYTHFLTFKDILKKNVATYKLTQDLFQNKDLDKDLYGGLATVNNAGGLGANGALFFPTLYMLSSDKQRAEWCPDVLAGRIIGGYAQTEMAHGSDIQSLQTTAVFDPATSTFVLNTPKLADCKFWPGGMGVFNTHVVMPARTYIHGKNHGIQTFFIQIRDVKTFEPLEGIEVGDIGAKLGFRSTDNGYLRITNVRIPWNHILMRFFEINEKGEVLVENAESARFGYGGMLNLRNHMVRVGVIIYLRAAIWSYEVAKNQAMSDQNLVASKFLQRMAFAISNSMMTVKLREFHSLFMKVLAANDIKAAKAVLSDLHLMTAGFKSYISWKAIQVSREVLGESSQANLLITERTWDYANVIPQATYEGDNSVLQQQLSRKLIKYIEMLMQGREIKGIGECFNIYTKNVQEKVGLTPFNLEKDDLTLESIGKLLLDITFKNMSSNAERFMMLIGEADLPTAWNAKIQTDLVHMSRLFLIYQGYKYSITHFKEVESKTTKLANHIASNLLLLHGLLKVKQFYDIGVLLGVIVRGGEGYGRLMSEIRKTEDLLKPHIQLIRDSISIDDQEIGIFKDFDSSLIQENAKPTRALASNIEKDFAFNFAKMSKL